MKLKMKAYRVRVWLWFNILYSKTVDWWATPQMVAVITVPASLLCITIPRCLSSLSVFLSVEHVKIHFTIDVAALPVPLYKMYNQAKIDRLEVGEDAGARGEET